MPWRASVCTVVGDLREVRVVVDAGLRLDRLPDHADADGVEADAVQERGVVIAEPDGRRVVRRQLVDHVDPVHDHDAAARVGDPAAGVAERQRRAVSAGAGAANASAAKNGASEASTYKQTSLNSVEASWG